MNIQETSDMANNSAVKEMLNVKQTGNVNHNGSRMVWFQAFRGEFGYSNFGENRTSVTTDIHFVIILYSCVLISVATLIVAAGIRGKERWYTLIRVLYSLAVGTIILVSLNGYCWQIGHITIRSPYIYRNDGEVDATLGIRVGLRTINLTLSGEYMDSRNLFKYNEEYQLEKVLDSPVQMSEALSRGLPAPLLFIIEHYDTDDGELRFGRGCFMAGYFANILLWASFISWVTGTILLCSVIWYGAALYILTGVCMLLSVIIYDTLCTDHNVKMPCTEHVLHLSYGWCFWSTLVFGILNTLIGLVVFTLENKAPKVLASFFQLETPFDDNDEIRIFTTPPSGSHTAHNTPVPSLRITKDSQLKSPKGWYVNSGFDGSKTNPLFIDSGSEPTSPAAINGRDVSKVFDASRKISQIKEEDTTSNVPNTDHQYDNTLNDETTFNRLNEIYIDVEPNHRKDGTLNRMFIQGLDDVIDGK